MIYISALNPSLSTPILLARKNHLYILKSPCVEGVVSSCWTESLRGDWNTRALLSPVHFDSFVGGYEIQRRYWKGWILSEALLF